MKTTPLFARVLLKGVLASGLALAVIASNPAFAEDAANTATATSTNETPRVAATNLPNTEPNTFALPKKAFDRHGVDNALDRLLPDGGLRMRS